VVPPDNSGGMRHQIMDEYRRHPACRALEDAMTRDLFELTPGFREKWPYAARYARVNGWRMHFVDEGDGDPVLLLHGNPTWGFLYRDVIGPLVH
jgi:hypothetical protein